MNVPLIPPLSVIETLIFVKKVLAQSHFFYLSLHFDRIKKGHKIKQKQILKKKSSGCNKIFLLGKKLQVFLPLLPTK